SPRPAAVGRSNADVLLMHHPDAVDEDDPDGRATAPHFVPHGALVRLAVGDAAVTGEDPTPHYGHPTPRPAGRRRRASWARNRRTSMCPRRDRVDPERSAGENGNERSCGDPAFPLTCPCLADQELRLVPRWGRNHRHRTSCTSTTQLASRLSEVLFDLLNELFVQPDQPLDELEAEVEVLLPVRERFGPFGRLLHSRAHVLEVVAQRGEALAHRSFADEIRSQSAEQRLALERGVVKRRAH